FGECLAVLRESGPTHSGLKSCRDDIGQRSLVVNGNSGVFDSKIFKNPPGLRADRFAIIRRDSRLETEFNTAFIAWLHGDVKIGAYVLSPMSSFCGTRSGRSHGVYDGYLPDSHRRRRVANAGRDPIVRHFARENAVPFVVPTVVPGLRLSSGQSLPALH